MKSLGRPAFIVLLLLLIGSWTSGSLLVQAYGWTPYDPPPFVWLQLAASVTALCITILILATQRRDDEIAERREHLALELAILSEQKLAKVIELLEESRRDNPLIPDRVDTSANAMARPTDPAWLANSVKTENNH